jgi:hypothetical protein
MAKAQPLLINVAPLLRLRVFTVAAAAAALVVPRLTERAEQDLQLFGVAAAVVVRQQAQARLALAEPLLTAARVETALRLVWRGLCRAAAAAGQPPATPVQALAAKLS